MPLHSWLPRAHPVAPSHVSALMSGVMIKVALYGLIRVLFEWLGAGAAVGRVSRCSALGLLSALGGVLYALVQHDLKRLLAFSLDRERRHRRARPRRVARLRRDGRPDLGGDRLRRRAPPRRSTTPLFKALLFLGAGAFERAAGSLDLDRLGGLLRRMPWTGGAFLVGALAIAGAAAAERLRLGVADPAGARSTSRSTRRVGVGARRRRRGRRRWPRPRRWPLFCFVKVDRARAARAAAAPEVRRGAARRRVGMRAAPVLPRRLLRGARRSSRDCCCRRWRSSRPAPATCARRSRARRRRDRLAAHARGSLLALVARGRACSGRLRGAARGAAPAPAWACGQPIDARARLDVGRLHQAAAARARGASCGREREVDASTRAGGVVQRGAPTAARSRTCSTRCSTGRLQRGALRGGRRRPPAPVGQRAHLRRLPARARCWSLLALARIGVLG